MPQENESGLPVSVFEGRKQNLINDAKALILKLATCEPDDEREVLSEIEASQSKRAPRGKLKPVK